MFTTPTAMSIAILILKRNFKSECSCLSTFLMFRVTVKVAGYNRFYISTNEK